MYFLTKSKIEKSIKTNFSFVQQWKFFEIYGAIPLFYIWALLSFQEYRLENILISFIYIFYAFFIILKARRIYTKIEKERGANVVARWVVISSNAKDKNYLSLLFVITFFLYVLPLAILSHFATNDYIFDVYHYLEIFWYFLVMLFSFSSEKFGVPYWSVVEQAFENKRRGNIRSIVWSSEDEL